MKKVPSGNLLLMTETSQHRQQQQLSRVSLNYLDSGHKFIGFIRPRLLKSTYLLFYISKNIIFSLYIFR